MQTKELKKLTHQTKLFVKSAENLNDGNSGRRPFAVVCVKVSFQIGVKTMPTTSTASTGVNNDVALQTQNTENQTQTAQLDSQVLEVISDIAAAVAAESSGSSEEGVVIVVSAEDISLISSISAPVEPPIIEDGQHPPFSLTVAGNLIRTIGGYAIELLEQFSWRIIGPDDTYTLVSQNPDVIESDGGAWDFMRDSSFVLGDGTRINVTVVSLETGATVTSQLDIICGADCVLVTGIDEGIGQIGTVTQDGLERLAAFDARDVFVAGSRTDTWFYFDDEIIGNYHGEELFMLRGLELRWLSSFFDNLSSYWQETWRPNMYGCNPYYGQDYPSWQAEFVERKDDDSRERQVELRDELQKLYLEYDSDKHLDILKQSFELFLNAHDSCSDFLRMSQQFSSLRYRSMEV